MVVVEVVLVDWLVGFVLLWVWLDFCVCHVIYTFIFIVYQVCCFASTLFLLRGGEVWVRAYTDYMNVYMQDVC